LKKPIATRYSVLDTIQAIFYDRYIPVLEKAYIESRMKTNLLTLLAQADAPVLRKPPSAAKQAKAGAARSLMLENPLKRLTIEEIAKVLHCSPSSVKKAFGNVYGKGMYEFLREQRMLIAKERLLKGESLKVVAIEMGINPRDFPKEFKLFFGYTITALINGSQ
jgi:AraC-like DNA-binding protein